MTHFSWLHLTDLHYGLKEQDWLWPGVREEFFKDLAGLHERCGPWDLVLFTGDLTQYGSSEEFEKVDELFKQLWEYFAQQGSDPILLAVPGNHDLVRPSKKRAAVRMLTANFSDIQEEFWDEEEGEEYHAVIARAFTPYTNWWEQRASGLRSLSSGLNTVDLRLSKEKELRKELTPRPPLLGREGE